MPSVPTTITCWTISDRLRRLRKRSAVTLKIDDREEQDEQRARASRWSAGCRGCGCRAAPVALGADGRPAVPAPCGAGTSLRSGLAMAV